VIIRLNSSYCNDTLNGVFPIRVAGPIAGFKGPGQVCAATSFLLESTSLPAYPSDVLSQWFWEVGNGLALDNKEKPDSFRLNRGGTFRIIHRVTDVNGCTDEARGTVAVRLNPLLSVFPSEVSFCQGGSVNLEAFSENPLKWQPPGLVNCDTCSQVIATLPNSGLIYVSTTDTVGCTSIDSVKLTARLPYVFSPTLTDTGFCQGSSVQLNSGLSGLRIRWSPADGLSNPNLPNPIAAPAATTIYRLEAVDSFYCFFNNAQVLVEVWPLPGIEPIPDVVAPYNSNFQFQLTYTTPDIVSYTWLPPGQLSCTTCTSPLVTAIESKEYTLRLVSSKGCVTETSARVVIECNPSNLLLPSAFTPNGDGLNERFFPVGRGISAIKKFMIYNRNGELVFSRYNFAPGDRNFGWDGTFANKKQSSGAFVYMVEALCDLGKTILKKGTILLIR
jgi:gliding motility-associated-like protein